MAQRQQFNIRLDDDDVKVLEAKSFLARQQVHELIRAAVELQIEAWRGMPQVQRALLMQAEAAAEEEGVLTSLDDARGKREERG